MQQAARGRLVLSWLFLVCVGTMGTMAQAQDAPEPPFTLKQLGPNAWAAINNPKAKAPAGANAGFVIGDDGVVVIDTFSADAAKELLAEIRKRTTLPVKFVVNTHYHLDHVHGNGVFVDAGAVVLAHRNVRGWVRTENLKFFGKDIKPELKAMVDGLQPPTLVYDDGLNLHLGSRVIQVRTFLGHTGGDSVVLIPDAKAAFGGDLFWRNMLPNLIDASTQPWIDTLDALVKSHADFTFVPGHGDVGSAQDVVAFRTYLATLRKLVSDALAQGQSGDALVQSVLPALTKTHGQLEYFKVAAPRNILDTEAELNGKKRLPQP